MGLVSIERLDDQEIEHCIAQELQSLVVERERARRMCEDLSEQPV
jgi:hypothetical protein